MLISVEVWHIQYSKVLMGEQSNVLEVPIPLNMYICLTQLPCNTNVLRNFVFFWHLHVERTEYRQCHRIDVKLYIS